MVEEVDVLLVLAADASGSVSDDRERMQRNGFAGALRNPAFLAAVSTGRLGRVAAVYVEWSNYGSQVTALRRGWPSFAPVWTVISDAASAERLAAAIPDTPRMTPGYTSLSGAIDYGSRIIAESGIVASRRVIDVSADGRNNDGRPVTAARDAALAAGITINGLALLDADPDLEAYFRAEVIGGPLAFVVPVQAEADFAAAVLRKLITEVAVPAASTWTQG
ncbi:MAG: DUF1194 domain-containing protein [Anaerolineae bacterium]|nr:DUF1194 domain-containing protein [Anaerolineae bacterium]